ncbi:hypothetical protein ACHAXR_004085, partial [Thalassiosira sp. AJA248-18]
MSIMSIGYRTSILLSMVQLAMKVFCFVLLSGIGSTAASASEEEILKQSSTSIHTQQHDEHNHNRKLWCYNHQANLAPQWHPIYSIGWTNGYCRYTIDCDSPGYTSELSCCNNAYAGQMSGKCISMLPEPPTSSPTNSDYEADFYYPLYEIASWNDGYCSNRLPLPFKNKNDRPNYNSALACCNGAYGGQMSGKCLSELPSPPSLSPTDSGGGLGIYYPDYDTSWDQAYCINTRPLPSGRPTYSTMLACCKSAFAGQISGKCISMLPSPPTISPTNSDRTALFWYPVYEVAWDQSGCSNKLPLPYKNINDRPRYDTHEACCAGAYSGQVSKSCICGVSNPPLGCPGVVEYTVTTVTTTIPAIITLVDITCPTEADEKAALASSLELSIKTTVANSLGLDESTLEVSVTSICGESVRIRRRGFRLLRRLQNGNGVDIEFQTVIKKECTKNCLNMGNVILDDFGETMSDTRGMEAEFVLSDNRALASSTILKVTVDPDKKSTTTVGVSLTLLSTANISDGNNASHHGCHHAGNYGSNDSGRHDDVRYNGRHDANNVPIDKSVVSADSWAINFAVESANHIC